MFEQGKTYDGYQTIRRIGLSNMAEVFLLRKTGHFNGEEFVVGKTILPNLVEDDRFKQLFEREIKIHKACSGHPAIANFLYEGTFNYRNFFLMEFIESSDSDLERLNFEKEIPEIYAQDSCKYSLLERISAFIDIADALAYVHELGFVHRDICPANLMTDGLLQGKLIDFGLAIEGSTDPREDDLVGRFSYLAPELWSFEIADSKSDQFAFGCTLYRCLTRRRPFGPKSAPYNERAKIIGKDGYQVPTPEFESPDIPKEMTYIIKKSMARNPNERYDNMNQVRDVLKEAYLKYERVIRRDLIEKVTIDHLIL
ncbi:MAG: serine/threonine-protein kinase [Candidatus Woesearchaeota archaeon]